MLKYLGVSRSGYRAFTRHKPSAAQQRKDSIKQDIRKIYDKSRQNYGAPKITVELRKSGEMISERTVGKYMREMGIRAQWSKPWIATTKDSDFSKELHNILDEQFNPDRPNAVWCTDITYIWTVDGFVYLMKFIAVTKVEPIQAGLFAFVLRRRVLSPVLPHLAALRFGKRHPAPDMIEDAVVDLLP